MNPKNVRIGMRWMIVLIVLGLIVDVVSAEKALAVNSATGYSWGMPLGAGIALGLAGVGTGLSQGQIGAAAVGMVAEDSSKFVTALIFTALPETIVLFGFLAMFLL